MKGRHKDVSSNSKSHPAQYSLHTSSSQSDSRHGRKLEENATPSVATSKNYADSRLRQFCLR